MTDLTSPQYIVIDLGGTQVRTAVADASGHLSGVMREPSQNIAGAEPIVAQIGRMARASLEASGTTIGQISSAVSATPGPLKPDTGVVYSPPNMVGWGIVPFRDMLERELGVPVRLVNDANAAAMGEYMFGVAQGSRVLAYFTVSTGIGGGVVIDGRLFEGVSGTAAEFGHMTIDRHGQMCTCGNIGCLEAISSGTAIARTFNNALAAGHSSEWTGDKPATAADVARLAEEGDTLASEIFRDAAEALGTGVVNVIHLFNPDIVVVGGGVTKAGPLLFGPVEEMVVRHTMSVPREAVRIVRAALGDNVGLMGAAAVALSGD